METRPELLTIDETAEFLRVSDKTVRRMIDDGRLKAVAIGRQWRIPREALAELTRPGGDCHMTVKRCISVVLVFVLGLFLAGCGPSKPLINTLPWDVAAYSYELAAEVATRWQPVPADPGYKWLVLEVAIANKSSRSERLNPFIYEFEFALSGKRYVNQLVWDDTVGGLGWSRDVQPGQKVRGDIYFQVPASLTGLSGARLVMRDTIRGEAAGWDISSVPQR
jgi:excisionase family DNA binding protein